MSVEGSVPSNGLNYFSGMWLGLSWSNWLKAVYWRSVCNHYDNVTQLPHWPSLLLLYVLHIVWCCHIIQCIYWYVTNSLLFSMVRSLVHTIFPVSEKSELLLLLCYLLFFSHFLYALFLSIIWNMIHRLQTISHHSPFCTLSAPIT